MPLFKRERRREQQPPPIPLEVILATKPVRNPAVSWSKSESGEVILSIKLEPAKPGLLSGFVKESTERKIMLDKVGSFVWERIDGERSVDGIAEQVARAFKLHRREAQTSLLAFLQMLAERGLITLAAPTGSASSGREGAQGNG